MANSTSPTARGADIDSSQMEECIDRLAELSRGSVEFSAFFRELLTLTVTPGGASQVILWMQVSSGRWSPVGQRPSDATIDPQTIDQRQALLNQIADSRRARFEAPGTGIQSNRCSRLSGFSKRPIRSDATPPLPVPRCCR